MKITVCTGNKNKFQEITDILDRYDIEAEHVEMDFNENGSSLEEIVVSKAKQAFQRIGKPLIVDDTGVFFRAYRDFPGHRAKRVFKINGFEGIFRALDGRPRDAYFRCLICYIDKKEIKVFEGVLEGTITHHVYESPGYDEFPYVKIFIPSGQEKPLSMLRHEEKSKIDHRGKAIKKFVQFFTKDDQDHGWI
jgi:XTP/dITP diphosphohydrolase